jgi:hypothetical protein
LSEKRPGKRSSEVRGKEEEVSNEWGRWQTGSEKYREETHGEEIKQQDRTVCGNKGSSEDVEKVCGRMG